MVENAAEILRCASAGVGLREDPIGSNDGPALRHALRMTPFQPGESWCYYWALAVLIEAFCGREYLPASVAYTGSCQVAADHAMRCAKLSSSPAMGSVFLLKSATGLYHHAGIVRASPLPDGRIPTIEGNTNLGGSPEGIGVFQRLRMPHYLAYIIW